MATKLTVFNGALAALGKRSLVALTDPVEERRVLESLWDNEFVNGCLEMGEWNFAVRTVKMTDDPPVPEFGFEYRFAKPSDWRRTVKVSAYETFEPQCGPGEYTDEGGYIYANVDELYFMYISSHPSYGGAMGIWPRTFSEYVELCLAMKAAPRLLTAEERQAKMAGEYGLVSMAQKALANAKSKDASNQAPEKFPLGTWARSRSAGATNNKND
jgi:hypothetical protein